MSTPEKIVDESLKIILKMPKNQDKNKEKESQDPLLTAVLDGKIEIAEKLMDDDADVDVLLNYRDPFISDTILTWAVRHNKLDSIKFIIKYPSLFSRLYEIPNLAGYTPRFIAAMLGNTYILFALFRENKLKVLDYKFSTVVPILQYLVGHKNCMESGIKFLFSLPNIVSYLESNRSLIRGFFISACGQENIRHIELLLSHIPIGEIIRIMEDPRLSPMLFALKQTNTSMLDCLLDKYTHKDGIIKSLITLQRNEIFRYSRAIHCLLKHGLTLEFLRDFRDAQQNTILHLLAKHGGNVFLKYIVSKQAFKSFINLPNMEGETPILLAALNGKQKCFEILLKQGGDTSVLVKYRAKNGDLLMHSIIRSKKIGIAIDLLNIDAIKQQAKEKNQEGLLPLILACFTGSSRLLHQFLSMDLVFARTELYNYRCDDGGNIFHALIKNNKTGALNEIISFLAENDHINNHSEMIGGLLLEENNDGETPLVFALRRNCYQSVRLMCNYIGGEEIADIKFKNGHNIMAEALELGHKEVLRELVAAAKKCDVESDFSYLIDVTMESGITTKMLAIIRGDVETQKILGVTEDDLHKLKSRDDASMLSEAAERGHLKNVQILLKNAKVKNLIDEPDKQGRTALFRAAAFGHVDIVDLLLKNGPPTNLKQLVKMRVGDNKKTILIYAAMSGSIEGIRYLLGLPEFTHLLNYQNTEGQTALMYVCHLSFVEIFKLLLNQGARVDLKDKDGTNIFTQAINTPKITKEMADVVASVKCFLELPKSPIFNTLRKLDAESLKEFREEFASCLKRGASLNTRTEKGNTLLHMAVLACNVYLLQELYKAGANLYALNDDGKTALQLFRDSQKTDLNKTLVISGRCTLLILYAREAYKEKNKPERMTQCLDFIREALEFYLDIEDKEIQGQFCLELAHWIKEETMLLEIFKIETVVELESVIPKESSSFDAAQFDIASLHYIEGRTEAAFRHAFEIRSYEGADVLRKEIQSSLEEKMFRENELDLLNPKDSLMFLKNYLKKMTPHYQKTDILLERTVAAKEKIEELQERIDSIEERNNVKKTLKRKELPTSEDLTSLDCSVLEEPPKKRQNLREGTMSNEKLSIHLNLRTTVQGTKRKPSETESEMEEKEERERETVSTVKKIKSRKFS